MDNDDIKLEDQMTEKVLDASTNIIWEELRKIRNIESSEKALIRRRWIWELIQNAVDCVADNRMIDIKIEYDEEEQILIFEHNGKGFTINNLMDIVTQISSKNNENNGKVGKFGTGFISTNLLSKKIVIESFIDSNKYPFRFEIKRFSETYQDLKKEVDKNLKEIKNIFDGDKTVVEYSTTKFIYDLKNSDDQNDSIEAINLGRESLDKNIHFLLAFNRKISTITFNDQCYKAKILEEKVNSFYQIVECNNQISRNKLFCFKKEKYELAFLYKSDERNFKKVLSIEPIPEIVPRLYSVFPLIGAEDFPFPIIINSNKFEVEKDRNGIMKGSSTNLEILYSALESYIKILENFGKKDNKPEKLFNLCKFNRIIQSDVLKNYANELRNGIVSIPLIKGHDGFYYSINNKEKKIMGVNPPKDDNNNVLWEILSLRDDLVIPIIEEYRDWSEIIDNRISVRDLRVYLSEFELVEELEKVLNTTDVYGWLSKWYSLFYSYDRDNYEKYLRVPNQSGEFIDLKNIYRDNTSSALYKEILKTIDPKTYKKIISHEVTIPNVQKFDCLNDEQIAKIIEEKVNSILSKETVEGNSEREKNIQIIFSKLYKQFIEFPEKSKNEYPILYENRMSLITKKQTIELLEISDVITSSNVDLEQIKKLIKEKELIETLLIEENVSQDILEKFKHIVNPTLDSKKQYDYLIERSIKNVFNYLSSSEYYILPETLEEWKDKKIGETVFLVKKVDGIMKKEINKRIVVRPSDGEKLILFYEKEVDALSENSYELWTDNGDEVSEVTLGDIIKVTGISSIPLKKIIEGKHKNED